MPLTKRHRGLAIYKIWKKNKEKSTLGARGFLAVILHASYVSYICISAGQSALGRQVFSRAVLTCRERTSGTQGKKKAKKELISHANYIVRF